MATKQYENYLDVGTAFFAAIFRKGVDPKSPPDFGEAQEKDMKKLLETVRTDDAGVVWVEDNEKSGKSATFGSEVTHTEILSAYNNKAVRQALTVLKYYQSTYRVRFFGLEICGRTYYASIILPNTGRPSLKIDRRIYFCNPHKSNGVLYYSDEEKFVRALAKLYAVHYKTHVAELNRQELLAEDVKLTVMAFWLKTSPAASYLEFAKSKSLTTGKWTKKVDDNWQRECPLVLPNDSGSVRSRIKIEIARKREYWAGHSPNFVGTMASRIYNYGGKPSRDFIRAVLMELPKHRSLLTERKVNEAVNDLTDIIYDLCASLYVDELGEAMAYLEYKSVSEHLTPHEFFKWMTDNPKYRDQVSRAKDVYLHDFNSRDRWDRWAGEFQLPEKRKTMAVMHTLATISLPGLHVPQMTRTNEPLLRAIFAHMAIKSGACNYSAKCERNKTTCDQCGEKICAVRAIIADNPSSIKKYERHIEGLHLGASATIVFLSDSNYPVKLRLPIGKRNTKDYWVKIAESSAYLTRFRFGACTEIDVNEDFYLPNFEFRDIDTKWCVNSYNDLISRKPNYTESEMQVELQRCIYSGHCLANHHTEDVNEDVDSFANDLFGWKGSSQAPFTWLGQVCDTEGCTYRALTYIKSELGTRRLKVNQKRDG